MYARGDGSDVITEIDYRGVDQLRFVDINAADVTLVRNGTDLIAWIKASGSGTNDEGFITMTRSVVNDADRGIEQVRFGNSVTWGKIDIAANTLYVGGTAANETITGTANADTVLAGRGNDTLIGQAGSDTFVFETGFGKDVINDFTAGAGSQDVIHIKNGLFSNYADVLAHSAQSSSDVVITLDAQNTITLKNVLLGNLHSDDFTFA